MPNWLIMLWIIWYTAAVAGALKAHDEAEADELLIDPYIRQILYPDLRATPRRTPPPY